MILHSPSQSGGLGSSNRGAWRGSTATAGNASSIWWWAAFTAVLSAGTKLPWWACWPPAVEEQHRRRFGDRSRRPADPDNAVSRTRPAADVPATGPAKRRTESSAPRPPRSSGVGFPERWLVASGWDRLPGLWNVLAGQIHLVGSALEVPDEIRIGLEPGGLHGPPCPRVSSVPGARRRFRRGRCRRAGSASWSMSPGRDGGPTCASCSGGCGPRGDAGGFSVAVARFVDRRHRGDPPAGEEQRPAEGCRRAGHVLAGQDQDVQASAEEQDSEGVAPGGNPQPAAGAPRIQDAEEQDPRGRGTSLVLRRGREVAEVLGRQAADRLAGDELRLAGVVRFPARRRGQLRRTLPGPPPVPPGSRWSGSTPFLRSTRQRRRTGAGWLVAITGRRDGSVAIRVSKVGNEAVAGPRTDNRWRGWRRRVRCTSGAASRSCRSSGS